MPKNSEDFLLGFVSMLMELGFASVFGGLIGIGMGALFSRSTGLVTAVLRLLRLGLWIPFLASWVFESSLLAGTTAVVLASCYYYLNAKNLGLPNMYVVRATVMQAFLIFLISQVWFSRYGWEWFTSERIGYGAATLIGCLFVLDLVFKFDFERLAEVRGMILTQEIAGDTSLRPETVLSGGCLVLSLFIKPAIWKDLAISMVEILVGMSLGAGAALLASKALARSVGVTRVVTNKFLPLTYIAPIVFPLFLLHRSVLTLHWQTMATIAALTFFPFVQAYWGLRGRSGGQRILLSMEDALPFAFIAMLFGETMNAFVGLGFQMAAARNISNVIAGSLATVALFLGSSLILRSRAATAVLLSR